MSLKALIYLCLDVPVGRETACKVTVQTCWLLLPFLLSIFILIFFLVKTYKICGNICIAVQISSI